MAKHSYTRKHSETVIVTKNEYDILEWIGLDQIGLDWIRLDQSGLDWIRLDQIGFKGAKGLG